MSLDASQEGYTMAQISAAMGRFHTLQWLVGRGALMETRDEIVSQNIFDLDQFVVPIIKNAAWFLYKF